MNKLEEINKRIEHHLDAAVLYPCCEADNLTLELLATLVELGDYVIRFDYWNCGNYYSENRSAFNIHSRFIMLARRVAALSTDRRQNA